MTKTEIKKWNDEDIEYLRELWGNINIDVIKNKLNRTSNAIKIKATRLGLGGAKTNSYRYITANKASKILNCEKHKILKWLHSGKLKAKFMAISQEDKVWCIDFEDFVDFLKNNQDKWDSKRVEQYALGYESEWLIKKRQKDREKSYSLRLYSKEDEKKIYALLAQGYTYKQIGEKMNRTEQAITLKIRKMYRRNFV